MFDHPIFFGTIIFAIFAFSEWISILTKARIPMLFVVMISYLLLLWSGIIPKNIAEKSYFLQFSSILPAILIVHMGTIIPIRQLKEQYKAVLISLSGILVASLFIFAIIVPIFGYTVAASGIGPLTGGAIAYIITSGKLTELGLDSLITVPALILSVQGLIGMPLANYFLRKYGVQVVSSFRKNSLNEVAATIDKDSKNDQTNNKSLIPKKYQTQTILIFQVFIGASLAILLDSITGISYSLWALFIGLIGSYFGFYVGNILERANSFGILMALLLVLVMSSLNSVTPSMFTNYFPEVVLILSVGVVGILIGGYFSSKMLKWDPNKGMPVAITALIGFPGDYLLCEEVSRSIGKNKEEENAIFKELLTPMLIGGFTTVTIASVVIAGILMSTL
ncbi:hypothetical protein [Fervidibacillus albus]|uniref:Uncharacterized protein n=1 Tax=Fervidibacillus albus TaxID=2980026 RepID=A0A9E8LTJ5_9BACI|nr:hypothetical protein [Fervidibacillus albus]WAA08544.1 hypothetical protein OE104_07745 [Fervidibacillus albus]